MQIPLEKIIDTTANIQCPYCNEPLTVAVDLGNGMQQQYIEDCQVCCQPMQLSVQFDEDGSAAASADQE